jgi:hypothetical protein
MVDVLGIEVRRGKRSAKNQSEYMVDVIWIEVRSGKRSAKNQSEYMVAARSTRSHFSSAIVYIS